MVFMSSITFSILSKITFLSINLVTGIIVARNLTVAERGAAGIVLGFASMFSIWLSTNLNEKSLHNRLLNDKIVFNTIEQLATAVILGFILFSLDLLSFLPWIYLLIVFSYFNSRLLNRVFNVKGIVIDRVLQLLHLLLVLIFLIAFSIFNLLDIYFWVNITLVVEGIFLIILLKINEFSLRFFQVSNNFVNLKSHLDYNNLFYVTELFGDRIVILILAFGLSTEKIGILSVAMSFLLIIGIPFTSSYPYPVKHAKIFQLRLQRIRFREFLLFFFVGLMYGFICLWGIIQFTPIVYGIKYSSIIELAASIVIAGFFLSSTKLLSSVVRGLNGDLIGNKLNFLAVVFSAVIALAMKEFVNPLLILFYALGILNACISVYLFYRVRNTNITSEFV